MTIGVGGSDDATKALLAAIVQSSHDAIVSKDLDGIVTSWNFGAERIFGYSAQEMIGQPIIKLFPEDRQDEEDFILERIRRGERIDHFETVRKRKDGRLIDVSLTLSPIRARNGKIIGVSKIARDITERKRAEETQRMLLREVNHRTKNMLAVVDSIVRQTALNSPSGDFVNRVSDRIQALSANQDLLISGDWRGVNILSLVKSQLGLQRELHNDQIRIEGEPHLLMPAAAQALGLALHELATNAIKHGALSRADGTVAIQWQVEDESEGPTFRLTWTEAGGPAVSKPPRSGFGTTILKNITARALGGKASLSYHPEGLVWTVSAPATTILGSHW